MFNGQPLKGSLVLILEDDYYQATDLEEALQAVDAVVLGPFGDEAQAVRAMTETQPALAVVDVNLGNGPSFQVPRELVSMGVPFVFVTGYDAGTIPDEFQAIPRCEKPIDARKIVEATVRLLSPKN